MSKKRVKSNKLPIIPVSDWQQVDSFLREMGDLEKDNQKDKVSANLKIDNIKAALAQSVNTRKIRIDQILRSLEAFAVNRKSEFKFKRTRKLAFGVIGWRKSTSTSTTKETLGLIKQVFSAAKAKTLINVKETVSRDALAKLTDEQLASVKARRKVTDGFFALPACQEAPDYNQ